MRHHWVTGVLFAASALLACKGEEPKPAQSASALVMSQEDLSAEALKILNRRCTACHNSERFSSRDFSPEEWNSVLERMVAKGAALSGEEMDVLRHWREPKPK